MSADLTAQEERKNHYDHIKTLLLKVDEAMAIVENYANEYGLEFYWGGPAYGMGGHYISLKCAEAEGDDDWAQSSGWLSSSARC